MIQPYCLAVWEKDTKTYFVFGAGLTIKEVTISSNESIIEWMHKSYWNNVADIHMFKCTREVYELFSITLRRSESSENSLKRSFKADKWGFIGIQEQKQ
jgi:hypothetical protein